MDIITAAIAGALGNLGTVAVQKAYSELKAVLQRKFGADSDVVEAVEKLEKKPEAQGRRLMLQEELEDAGATKDNELIQAAKVLLAQVKQETGSGVNVTQTVTGDKNIFSGTGDVNVNR